MQKITKLGVINFVDYPQQEIDVHGNAVVIKATNGTGKTLLMTALYPALFTLDLQRSLNMGQKNNRKLSDILNNQPTYIYGCMYINNEPKTIVTAYVQATSATTKRAYIINGHNVQFLDDQDEPLSLHEFERVNAITESFSSIKSYQEYVAQVIYKTSLDNFKTLIQISNKITSPSIINANNDKSTYNMEDLLDQVKEVLPSLTNDDAFNQQLTTYGEQLIKANDEQNKIHKLRQEKAAIAKERHIVSQANQKAIAELNTILADMERHSDKNQQKLDGLDEEIQSLEIQIEQNENERSEIEDKLAKIEQEKQFVQSQIQNLNIDAQIQALETELRYLSNETQLKSKNDEYNDLHHRQSEFQDALTQSKNIVNSINIDEYSISEELQKIDTTQIQINSKSERLTLPDVPKSTYAKDFKQQLNNLTVTEIIDENGITHSLKARMDALQEAIDSANQNATTLLENNEKSLRLILRDQLKSVNEHVSENVDAFVANMNRSNPSHLQFSAKSSISNQGRDILTALEDQEHYNNFFNQLQERIHQQLQNPDITPDDIIEYMLAEIEPRRWYDLAMFYERDNNQEIKPLTTQAINSFSTGERVRCYYIPMFALLEIVQSQMNPDAPRILLMDEAFAPVDNEQTALLLEKIYDLCDLFIATTPGKTLPIVSNSTGSTTLQLQRININGRPVVQSFGGPIYEEIA